MSAIERYTGTVEPRPADHEVSAATLQAIRAGRAEATRRAYATDRESFVAWCAATGRTPVPATAATLAEYTAHLTATPTARGRSASPSSIERALSAISTLHEELDLPKPGRKAAREVLNGYKAKLALAKDPAARPSKATPAVPTALKAMLAGLDRCTLRGKRDAALLLLGFATAARTSELVALDVADIIRTEHGLDTTLYRRKVKLHTENAILYGADPATCLVRAVLAYTETLGRADEPLFVRIDRHGRLAAPMTRGGKPIGDPSGRITPEAAADVIASLADAAKLEGKWSGHSLRRGFATAARRAGHDQLRIGRTGGWADGSKALAGYLEDVDRITDSPLIGIGL
jgi:site-specific recombinase XerD